MGQTDILLNQKLRDALATIMELPKGIVSLDLRMRMGEAPQLTCTTYVYDAQGGHVVDGDQVQMQTKTYHLVEVSNQFEIKNEPT